MTFVWCIPGWLKQGCYCCPWSCQWSARWIPGNGTCNRVSSVWSPYHYWLCKARSSPSYGANASSGTGFLPLHFVCKWCALLVLYVCCLGGWPGCEFAVYPIAEVSIWWNVWCFVSCVGPGGFTLVGFWVRWSTCHVATEGTLCAVWCVIIWSNVNLST